MRALSSNVERCAPLITKVQSQCRQDSPLARLAVPETRLRFAREEKSRPAFCSVDRADELEEAVLPAPIEIRLVS